MIFGGLATSNSVPFCPHYTKHPAFVKTRNADAFHTAGQALCGEPLFSWLVKPFGENPSERFALSSPFRGAMSVAGYNIRCRKAMPPLKGRGGPRSGGEVRPRRQRLPIPQPTHTQQNPQGRIPGGLALRGIFLNQIRGRLADSANICGSGCSSCTISKGVVLVSSSSHFNSDHISRL